MTPHPDFIDYEAGFWDATDVLRRIYRGSLAMMVSPWGVLANLSAMALHHVPPDILLPGLVGGGPAPLNTIDMLASASGGGKGGARGGARAFHPTGRHVHERGLGSAEGLVNAYYEITTTEDENGKRHPERQRIPAVLFRADESDGVLALTGRNANGLMAKIREAWSGETIDFTYVSRPTLTLAEHSYRFGAVIATQPARAGWLVDDVGGGTAQRLRWSPATDPRISERHASNDRPERLQFPDFTRLRRDLAPTLSADGSIYELPVPASVERAVRQARVAANRGTIDAIDGHTVLAQEKFAYALTVLHNRIEMTDADWELAEVAFDVSDVTREWVAEGARAAADDEAREKGRRQGVARAATDETVADATLRRNQRIAEWALDRLRAKGAQTIGRLRKDAKSCDRAYVEGVLGQLALQGAVHVGEPLTARGGPAWRLGPRPTGSPP